MATLELILDAVKMQRNFSCRTERAKKFDLGSSNLSNFRHAECTKTFPDQNFYLSALDNDHRVDHLLLFPGNIFDSILHLECEMLT